jgi:hypothetical protein
MKSGDKLSRPHESVLVKWAQVGYRRAPRREDTGEDQFASTMSRAALALLSLVFVASESPLRVVSDLKTAGAAGFAFFEIDAIGYLLAANFWDGLSGDMGTDNVLYAIDDDGGEITEVGAPLRFREVQRIRGKGSHGADAFSTPAGQHYVTIPMYYECGGGDVRGRVAEDAECRSTGVYRFSRERARLVETQRLATSGPAATGHFTSPSDGFIYIVVGENFADEISFWRLVRSSGGAERFERAGQVACAGAGAMAVFVAQGAIFLAAASYHDPSTGWSVRSRLFVSSSSPPSAADLQFELIAHLSGFGAHGAEVLFDKDSGSYLLFFAEDRGPQGPHVNSSVWAINLDRETAATTLHSSIPSDGAHGASLFTGPDGATYIFCANFGDRLGNRVDSLSQLWRRRKNGSKVWDLVESVRSHGATDSEHFVWKGRHFLALANEGDIGKRLHQKSVIYELAADTGGARDL